MGVAGAEQEVPSTQPWRNWWLGLGIVGRKGGSSGAVLAGMLIATMRVFGFWPKGVSGSYRGSESALLILAVCAITVWLSTNAEGDGLDAARARRCQFVPHSELIVLMPSPRMKPDAFVVASDTSHMFGSTVLHQQGRGNTLRSPRDERGLSVASVSAASQVGAPPSPSPNPRPQGQPGSLEIRREKRWGLWRRARLLRVATGSGEELVGWLVHVGRSSMIVFPDNGRVDSQKTVSLVEMARSLRVFHVSEVESTRFVGMRSRVRSVMRSGLGMAVGAGAVTVGTIWGGRSNMWKEILFLCGVGGGFVAGGGLGVVTHERDSEDIVCGNAVRFERIRSKLSRASLFRDELPDEIRQIAHDVEIRYAARVRYGDDHLGGCKGRKMSLVHVSVGVGSVATDAGGDIARAFEESGLGHVAPKGSASLPRYGGEDRTPHLNLAVEIGVLRRLRVGASVFPFLRNDVAGWRERERADGESYSAFVSFLPLLADNGWVRSVHGSRLELAVGGGANLTAVSMQGNLSADAASATVGSFSSFSQRKWLLGVHWQATLDYYVAKSVSWQLKLQQRLLPAAKVPSLQHTSPSTGTTRQMRAHSVDFSATGISFGVVVHI